MSLTRRPVEWLAAPDEDEDVPDDGLELEFELHDEWVAVDADQLILPVMVHRKTTIDGLDEPYPAILKQYGGEGLLNDLLLADQDVEKGSRWVLIRGPQGLRLHPA